MDQLVIVKVEVRGLLVQVHRSDGGVVAVGVEDGWVRYSNVSWLALTVPLLKSCMMFLPVIGPVGLR